MKKLAALAVSATVITVIAVAVVVTVGGVTLVRTRGISMEPGFVAGDLAVLRRATHYAVGDVATYRSEDLDTVVMHRIVAIDGDVYTFQGDNNDWLDPEHPTRDQLIGTLLFKVPQGGLWLDRATSPAVLSAIAFLLIAGGTTAATGPRRRRRRQQRQEHTTSKTSAGKKLPVPATVWMLAAGATVLAVGAVGLGSFAASLPARAEPVVAVAEGATMTFSYEATVGSSAAYDSTTVTQPQPVFRKLADEVTVMFAYEGPELSDATVDVSAVLTTPNGWRSTVPLDDATTFSGTTYEGDVLLRIPDLQARANAATAAIGGGPSGNLSVAVVPELTSDDLTFSAELPFVLDGVALRLAAGDKTPLVVDQAMPAPTSAPQPSAPTLLGRPVLAGPARQAAIGGFLLALVLGVAAAVLARRHKTAPAEVTIKQRFGSLLLPVAPVVLPAGRPVIDVPDIEGLVRLADRYGLFVLYWVRGDVHTYVVLEDNTTYRFRTGAAEVDLTQAEQARPDAAADQPWLTSGS